MARARAAPQFTDEGSAQVNDAKEEFVRLVEARATENCRRRGAAKVDDSDVRDARRALLSPRDRPLVVDIGAEVGLWGSGALVGYATTLLTSTSPLVGPGRILLLTGLLLGGFCATLKHIRF
jgi:hypothetical protein